MKKTKILHVITLSVVGGAQDNTFCNCELHDRRRYEVHLACNPDGQWVDRARHSCDVFHSLPTLVTPVRPLHDLRALFDLVRLLRREKYELIHTHTAKAGFLGRIAAWLCGVPVIVHTYHAFPWHNFMPAWLRTLYILLERACRPLTDYFITVSENEREEGRRRRVLRWEESKTLYSGIDYSKLDQPVDVAALRAQLDIPPERPVILMVGRLQRQKSPELMVRAFRRVVDAHPQSLLLFAGDGELRPLVEEMIRCLGLEENVRILGFRNDVPALMEMADVFALSSLWEGLGRAMTEAMLLGKPVVMPAINGIPEIVRHRQNGLLYDVGSEEQLAEHLCWLLARPAERTRLGENASRFTRGLFDVNQMVAGVEQIYEALLPQAVPNAVPFPQPAAVFSEKEQRLDQAA